MSSGPLEDAIKSQPLVRARGFGLGVVLATQNPMDLDYRALSNAGLWCVGRFATDASAVRTRRPSEPGATPRGRMSACKRIVNQ
jgi:DNA helicase HerA-like ATPase